MEQIQRKVPGIIGGMGPLAHTVFEQILIEQNAKRGVKTDQGHPLWFLVNATNIPNRTESLSEEKENCAPWLVKYGKLLQSVGVDFLVIPCNTAHAFYTQVQPELQIPWVHLIDCTAQFLAEKYPNAEKIGIVGTDGTLQASLYQNSLNKQGFSPLSFKPDSECQKRVMDAIYHPNWGIKTTGSKVSASARKNLQMVVDHLAKQGAEIVIAGCTELSAGFHEIEELALPWVDPLEIIANVALDIAYGYRSLPKKYVRNNGSPLTSIQSLLQGC